jgi:methionine-rich copper-binding protein CopC
MAALARALVFAAACLVSSAAAHAYFEGADPGPGAVHEGTLERVTLRYTMPVEPRFSRFEVYRLELAEGAEPADGRAPTPREIQRIEALAAALAAAVRAGTLDASVGHPIEGDVAERSAGRVVTIELREPITTGGVYVVVWEALATDTHTTRDHHVFLVAPAEE